jgi:hypothetical protein
MTTTYSTQPVRTAVYGPSSAIYDSALLIGRIVLELMVV